MSRINRTTTIVIGIAAGAIALAWYSGTPQAIFGTARAQTASAPLSYAGAARRTTNQSYYSTGPGRFCAQVVSPMGGMTTQCP